MSNRPVPEAVRPAPSKRRWLPWAVAGLLLVAVVVVYGQTLGSGFKIEDDSLWVTMCPQVQAGLTGPSIEWAFTSGPGGTWFPLAMLSHMLDVELFGSWPVGHHLTNVLLHAATVVSLFFVLRAMTGELWPSALVAALLAVHPQHVESVAWIAERRDVLSGLLFVLTLGAYLGYVRSGRSVTRYLLVVAAFALALMAKTMVVTLPALLLLLDFWPLGRFGGAADLPDNAPHGQRPGFGWLILEKVPLFVLSAGGVVMTLTSHTRPEPLAWSERITNATVAIVTYLVHSLYPLRLAVFYPYAVGGEPMAKVAVAAALLGAITAAAVLGRRRFPYGFVGWFWFLGMLTPVLGLVQVSAHSMADRYMYLPGIGLYIALAWGGWRWAETSDSRMRLAGAVAAATIVLLVGLGARQAGFWRDDETLWKHSASVTGENFRTEARLGEAARVAGRLREAGERFHHCIELRPDPETMINYGMILFEQHKLDEAGEQFRRALDFKPPSAVAMANLGTVLGEQGHPQEAINHFVAACQIDQMLLLPRLNLAKILAREGFFKEAFTECQKAIAVAPGDPAPRQLLAELHAMQASQPSK